MKKSLFRIITVIIALAAVLTSFVLVSCNTPDEPDESNKQDTPSAKNDFIKNLENYDERYAKGMGDILILIFEQGDSVNYSVTLEFKNSATIADCYNFTISDEIGKEFIEKAKAVYFIEESEAYVRILVNDGAMATSNESGFYEYLSSFVPVFPKLPISSSLSDEERAFLRTFYRDLVEYNERYSKGLGDLSINIFESNGEKTYYVKLGYLNPNGFDKTNRGFYLDAEKGAEFVENCKEYFEVENLTDTLIVVYSSTEKGTTSKHVALFNHIYNAMKSATK